MKMLKIMVCCLGTLPLLVLYTSCTRTSPMVATTQSDYTFWPTVQVFNATVKSTRNYVYVDGAPVSGTALAYGGVFPGTSFGVKLYPGVRNFLIKDTALTTAQVPISFSENLDQQKSYTIFMYDTTTSVKRLTVLNDIVVPRDTTARLRFGNFIYNTTAVPNVDVYSFRRGTTAPVFSNVATNQVTDFMPYASGLTDTLYVYATGTTTPLLVKAAIPSLTPTRSYTSVYSGSYRGTKAIATFATY